MNIIEYIRKKGIKHFFTVFYQYKIDAALRKCILPFVKRKPLKDTVIIESHNDFDCNGGAFYNYLVEQGYNERYKIVWLLKHSKPKSLPPNVKAYYLFRPNLRKCYHVCTAKYLCADNTVTPKERAEQRSFYLTHGAVALKNVKGVLTVPPSVDYVLCTSRAHAPIIADQVSISRKTQMLPIGVPSEDIFFRDIPDEYQKLTDKQYAKRILWMPTFRKGGGVSRNDSTAELPLGIPLIEDRETLLRLNEYLASQNALLVIKLHPMQDPKSYAGLEETDHIRVLNGQTVKALAIDNYRLLMGSDALLSDYSSISFAFLRLDRPLGFVLSDLKDYKLGLSVEDPEPYLAGQKIFTFDDMLKFLKDVIEGRDEYVEKRHALQDYLFDYRDGNAAKRLADFMGLEK